MYKLNIPIGVQSFCPALSLPGQPKVVHFFQTAQIHSDSPIKSPCGPIKDGQIAHEKTNIFHPNR